MCVLSNEVFYLNLYFWNVLLFVYHSIIGKHLRTSSNVYDYILSWRKKWDNISLLEKDIIWNVWHFLFCFDYLPEFYEAKTWNIKYYFCFIFFWDGVSNTTFQWRLKYYFSMRKLPYRVTLRIRIFFFNFKKIICFYTKFSFPKAFSFWMRVLKYIINFTQNFTI